MDKIVERVCELTLPTRDVLTSVGSCSAWRKKVTSVILCAGKIAEDTSCVFQFLSLCRNFCALIQHFNETELRLANLADLGKNLQNTIATAEVFRVINNEIQYFRRKADNDLSVQMVEDFEGTFFIRAFDANPDDCFLTTALETMCNNKDGNLTAYASPLLYRIIEGDVEDGINPGESFLSTGLGVIRNEICIDQDQLPNLYKLETFMKLQDEIDNPVAVLCCDLIQIIIFGQLDRDDEVILDTAQKSVSVVAKSRECTMQLIFSIALLSTLFKTLIKIPKEELKKKMCCIFRMSLEEDELRKKRIFALKVLLLKHLRQMYSMHDLMDICDQLEVVLGALQISATNVSYSPMSDVECFGEVKNKLQKFEDKKTQENEFGLGDILVKAKTQKKMALGLTAVIVDRFVLSRSMHIDQLASTEKQFMETIAKKVIANLSESLREFSQFIELLLNETILSEFRTFARKRGSDVKNVLQQISVIAHIMSIILVQCNSGLFYQCLNPVKSMVLPVSGTPVPKLTAENIEISGSWILTCPSCSEQVIGSQSTSSEAKKQLRCPTCQASLKHVSFQSQNVSRGTLDTLTTGYRRRSEEELLRPDLSIRAFHPITYRVLSIITHSIFLMGHYISPEDNELDKLRENDQLELFDLRIEESVDIGATMKIKEFLCEQIDQDWNVLQTLLQTNIENTAVFLHKVVSKSSDILQHAESFKSLSFQTEFSKITVDVYRSEYLQNFKKQLYRCMGLNDSDLAVEIDELCEQSSLQLPRFFRYKRNQTFTHFKMDVLNNIHYSDELSKRHMFLCLVISLKDQLECLCHMKPIIDWYRIVFNSLSHRIKRQDARKCIKKFIESERLGSSINEHFDSFKRSWNAVERNWKIITGKEPTFGQMSDERELAVCLDQSEDQPGQLKTIINVLVEIHNQFLLKTHRIATSGRCPALKVQMGDDQIAALETIPFPESNKDTILFAWNDRLLINSYIFTKEGEHIKYDYASIERQLCTKLILNKKLLSTKYQIFRFVFLDEILAEFTHLLQEIALGIPQEKINKQIQEDINRRYPPGDEKSKKVLRQIEIVLSFLQRSGGESKQQLYTYTSDLFVNSATNEFSSEPFKTLQICHAVHLYELFEDIMATPSLLKLSKDVCETLEIGVSSNFESNLAQLDMKDLVSLSSVVRTFAYRYLQSSVVDADKVTSPLSDVVAKKMTIALELAEVIRCIPEEVQVCHARDAINIIEIHIEKLRQSSRPPQVQSLIIGEPKQQRQRQRSTKRARNLDLL